MNHKVSFFVTENLQIYDTSDIKILIIEEKKQQ